MAQNLATATEEQVDAAIRQTALDYIEGWNDGDPARMERGLHPELAKRRVIPNGASPSSLQPGDQLDARMTALTLSRMVEQWHPTPVDKRRAEIPILDHCANAASVRLDAST